MEVESKSLLVKLIVDQEFLLDEVVPESDLRIPATGGDSGSPQPASIPDGSITIAKLSEKVIEELRKTITKEMLSTQILADLNRTITLQNLDSNVVELLNQTITRDMLDPEILNEISSTQKIVGTSNDPYQEGLAAYLRPMLTGGIWHSWGVSGMPVTLRSPSMDGRFLNYQWYKNGEAIVGASSEEYAISEFDPDQDAGEYEIQVSNAYATLKTKAVLNTGVGIGVGIGGSGDFMSEINSIRMKSDGVLTPVLELITLLETGLERGSYLPPNQDFRMEIYPLISNTSRSADKVRCIYELMGQYLESEVILLQLLGLGIVPVLITSLPFQT